MKLIACVLLAFGIAFVPAHADPVLYLNPSSQVSGTPGQTVGWGFTLSANDSHYYVVDSFSFVPLSPSLGPFTDFSQYNFIDVGPGMPETQLFSATDQTGVGALKIANTAEPGTTLGDITMVYDVYQGNPADGGALLDSGESVFVPASVAVMASTATVPEPSTWSVVSGAALLLISFARRRARDA